MPQSTLKHHTLDSNYAKWAKYDTEKQTLYVCFPGGQVYAYKDVPLRVFENLTSAKDSTDTPTETTRSPIGKEKAGSEGSYLIHHVIGIDRKKYPYCRLSDDEAEALSA